MAAKHLIDKQFPLDKEGPLLRAITLRPGLPFPRSSKTSPSRRSRMARSWCARWRSASAAPTARSSPATTARRRPAASGWCSATNRWRGDRGAARRPLCRRRPRRRHRAAARPGALPGLRRRRMGHVPQRPLHRARHQGPARLRRRAFRIEPSFAVKVDPALGELGVLLEPTSIVAKAWDHIERIGRRPSWEPRRLLVTGAGPIGLLAALMGAQRGFEVHVLDRARTGRSRSWSAISARTISPARSATSASSRPTS